MATSRKRGLTSSSQEKAHQLLDVDETRACNDLCALFEKKEIKNLINALDINSCFLVGGVVRDALIGKPVYDLDIAVSFDVQKTISLLSKAKIRVVETGIEHGTVLAVLNDDEDNKVEITSFRTPSSRNENKLGGSIEEDLSGRDFTINAIAFSLATKKFIDPFSGIKDLKNNHLRAVDNAKDRFLEDPHRILRAIRFGPGSLRTLDKELEEAIRELAPRLKNVSAERIKQELDRILLSADPVAAVRAIKELGLLPYTFPELIAAIDFEQNEFHIHDVFEHTLWVLERSEPELFLRWAALYHDAGKPPTLSVDPDGRRHFYRHELKSEDLVRERFEQLKVGNAETEAVATLVRYHMRPLDCGPSAVRRLLRDLGPLFDTWLKLKRADAPPIVEAEEFEKDYAKFTALVEEEKKKQELPEYGKLAIDGNNLIELGMKPGPEMGKLLTELEELVIEDPEKNRHDILLEEAKKRINL